MAREPVRGAVTTLALWPAGRSAGWLGEVPPPPPRGTIISGGHTRRKSGQARAANQNARASLHNARACLASFRRLGRSQLALGAFTWLSFIISCFLALSLARSASSFGRSQLRAHPALLQQRFIVIH